MNGTTTKGLFSLILELFVKSFLLSYFRGLVLISFYRWDRRVGGLFERVLKRVKVREARRKVEAVGKVYVKIHLAATRVMQFARFRPTSSSRLRSLPSSRDRSLNIPRASSRHVLRLLSLPMHPWNTFRARFLVKHQPSRSFATVFPFYLTARLCLNGSPCSLVLQSAAEDVAS